MNISTSSVSSRLFFFVQLFSSSSSIKLLEAVLCMANSPVSELLDDVSSSLSSKKNWKIYDGLIMVQNLIHDFQQTNRTDEINNKHGQEKK